MIVVEHDRETILAADHLIDMGPGAGVQGGHVVATGRPAAVMADPASLTGRYLSGAEEIPVPAQRRRGSGWSVGIRGARANNLRNGSGRIVSTSVEFGCVAFAMDRQHTVEDPAVCSTCQPPSLATLPTFTPCSPTLCDDGNPCTVDGCDVTGACTHVAGADGTACDDGNPCTTQDTCNAGVCSGSPIVCGTDTPCDQVASCDPGTGQCGAIPPVSMCVPGGGKPG